MAAAAAPVPAPVPELSDGFISTIGWARATFRLRDNVAHPLIAPPDTATVVANTFLLRGRAALRQHANAEIMPKAMKIIRPTAGLTEVLQYRPIIQALTNLGGRLPPSGTRAIDTRVRLLRHFDYVANFMLFPAKNVTWEGIAMLLTYILRQIVEMIMADEQIRHVLRWLFRYIQEPISPATNYPGIQDWIDQRNWNDIVYHVVLLDAQPPVVPRTPVPAITELCQCALIRKDRFNDKRFPFFTCCMCLRGWCRVENCREIFPTLSRLKHHLARCHRYLNRVQQNCTCGQPKTRRQDFQASYECCGNCGAFWCRVNGCEQTLQNLGSFNEHNLAEHPDPYVCRKCGVQPKPRDGSISIGPCSTCEDNFWCLRGYCVEELETEDEIVDHVVDDCTWFDVID